MVPGQHGKKKIILGVVLMALIAIGFLARGSLFKGDFFSPDNPVPQPPQYTLPTLSIFFKPDTNNVDKALPPKDILPASNGFSTDIKNDALRVRWGSISDTIAYATGEYVAGKNYGGTTGAPTIINTTSNLWLSKIGKFVHNYTWHITDEKNNIVYKAPLDDAWHAPTESECTPKVSQLTAAKQNFMGTSLATSSTNSFNVYACRYADIPISEVKKLSAGKYIFHLLVGDGVSSATEFQYPFSLTPPSVQNVTYDPNDRKIGWDAQSTIASWTYLIGSYTVPGFNYHWNLKEDGKTIWSVDWDGTSTGGYPLPDKECLNTFTNTYDSTKPTSWSCWYFHIPQEITLKKTSSYTVDIYSGNGRDISPFTMKTLSLALANNPSPTDSTPATPEEVCKSAIDQEDYDACIAQETKTAVPSITQYSLNGVKNAPSTAILQGDSMQFVITGQNLGGITEKQVSLGKVSSGSMMNFKAAASEISFDLNTLKLSPGNVVTVKVIPMAGWSTNNFQIAAKPLASKTPAPAVATLTATPSKLESGVTNATLEITGMVFPEKVSGQFFEFCPGCTQGVASSTKDKITFKISIPKDTAPKTVNVEIRNTEGAPIGKTSFEIVSPAVALNAPLAPKLSGSFVDGDVQLKWDAAGKGVYTYTLLRDDKDFLIQKKKVPDLTYTDVAPPAGKHTYQLQVLDQLLNSQVSNIYSLNVTAKPAVVAEEDNAVFQNVLVGTYNSSTNRVTLDWTAPADGKTYLYTLLKDGTAISSLDTEKTFVDDNVEAGKEYNYKVMMYVDKTSIKAAGESGKVLVKIPAKIVADGGEAKQAVVAIPTLKVVHLGGEKDAALGKAVISYEIMKTGAFKGKGFKSEVFINGELKATFMDNFKDGDVTYGYTYVAENFEIKDGDTVKVVTTTTDDLDKDLGVSNSQEFIYHEQANVVDKPDNNATFTASQSIPNGKVGVAYSFTLTGNGGVAPYSWELAGGDAELPPGLTFDHTGEISGMPTDAGTATIDISGFDSTPNQPKTVQKSYTFTIADVDQAVVVKPNPDPNPNPPGGGNGGSGGGSGGGGSNIVAGGTTSPTTKYFHFKFQTSPLAKHFDLKGNPLMSQITILVNAGVMSGYNKFSFGPNDPLTRAQFLKMVVNAFQLTSSAKDLSPCKDVAKSAWYAKYFTTAKNLQVIKGYTDGSCKPNQAVTRAEATKILFQAIASMSDNVQGKTATLVIASVGATDVNPFSDVSPKSPLYKYIVSAEKYGFVKGITKGIFAPDVQLTRAQAAKILVQALSKLSVPTK